MKVRTAVLGMVAFFVVSSGGGCETDPLPPPGSGEGGGFQPDPNENKACGEGASCNLSREFCCSGKAILRCSGGKYVQHDFCGGGVAECTDGNSSCGCTPGATSCLNNNTIQTCVVGDSGDTFVLNDQCRPGEMCGTQACVDPVDHCIVGEMACDLDGDSVVRCERVPELGNVARFRRVLSCRDSGLEFCAIGEGTSSPISFCRNECGGQGIPLDHRVCAPGENGDPPCGVYICNGPFSLTLDHTGCLIGGHSCSFDEECVSCSCVNGICQGSSKAFCGDALKACAD